MKSIHVVARNLIALVLISFLLSNCSKSSEDKQSNSVVPLNQAFYLAEDTVKKYEKQAEQGDPDAARSLATYYYLYISNCEKGNYWNKKAAGNGHNIAQFDIGRDYMTGEGDANNYKLAKYWLEKAAKNGNARAKEYLTFLLTDKEVKDLSSQANKGDANAAYRLYKYYYFVKHEHDAKELYWLKIAAKNGNKEAKDRLPFFDR